MIALAAKGALIGVGATILFDLWLALIARGAPNMAPLGRWVWGMREGVFRHADIARAAPARHETALGWAVHYAVGIAYGKIFALLMGPGWMAAPSLGSALAFGIVTLGAGWFVLQPCLGLGVAAARTPDPWRRRAEGLIGHAIFGLGLWLTALAL